MLMESHNASMKKPAAIAFQSLTYIAHFPTLA